MSSKDLEVQIRQSSLDTRGEENQFSGASRCGRFIINSKINNLNVFLITWCWRNERGRNQPREQGSTRTVYSAAHAGVNLWFILTDGSSVKLVLMSKYICKVNMKCFVSIFYAITQRRSAVTETSETDWPTLTAALTNFNHNNSAQSVSPQKPCTWCAQRLGSSQREHSAERLLPLMKT